jgi:hypothetical protein
MFKISFIERIRIEDKKVFIIQKYLDNELNKKIEVYQ